MLISRFSGVGNGLIFLGRENGGLNRKIERSAKWMASFRAIQSAAISSPCDVSDRRSCVICFPPPLCLLSLPFPPPAFPPCLDSKKLFQGHSPAANDQWRRCDHRATSERFQSNSRATRRRRRHNNNNNNNNNTCCLPAINEQ